MMTSLNSTRVQAPATTTTSGTVLYDVMPLNPAGRGNTDVTEPEDVNHNSPTGLLRPKKNIRLATLNVRTISNDSKVNELIANAEQHHINILCLQEHRHFHKEVDIR